jgi:hypothetical protein
LEIHATRSLTLSTPYLYRDVGQPLEAQVPVVVLHHLQQVLYADSEVTRLVVARLVADDHARQQRLCVQDSADLLGTLVHVKRRAYAVPCACMYSAAGCKLRKDTYHEPRRYRASEPLC